MSEGTYTLITRLVVKNYRSLQDVDIVLKNLTVFVGENGAGKSNVIDVLRFVRDALTNGVEQAVKERGGIRALRCWFAHEDEEVSIHLHLEAPSWAAEYGFAFGNGTGETCQLKSEQLSIRAIGDERFQELFFKVVDGQLVKASHQFATLSKESFYLCQLDALGTKAVRDFLVNMSFYELSPAYMRKPQKVLFPFPLLETGENLASTLQEMQKRSQDYLITEALDVVAPGLDGYLVENMGQHLVTKLHYTFQNGHSLAVSSDLRDESDGTIRMLAILAALYQERFPSLLTIEEPEKTIYTSTLAVLSDALQEGARSAQILITTHRPDLLDDLPVDSFLIVDKEDYVTNVGPLIDYQRKTIAQHLFSPGELLQMEGLHRAGASLRAKV